MGEAEAEAQQRQARAVEVEAGVDESAGTGATLVVSAGPLLFRRAQR